MSEKRRIIESGLFVLVSVAIGFAFRMDAGTYVLANIPLWLIFQLVIRRAPLPSCWVRDARSFRFGWHEAIIAIVLVAGTLVLMIQRWSVLGWPMRLDLMVAVLGAIPAAFALRHWNKVCTTSLVLCIATAGVIGCGLMVLQAISDGKPLQLSFGAAGFMLRQFLLQFTALFLCEEVAFRGVLDAHVHHPGDRRSWLSAIIVSELWGLWHLPLAPPGYFWRSLVIFSIAQVSIGIGLSIAWRRCGNLAVPAIVHALVDATRNTLLR
jgi:membrane protease YdiL (CAAX protease family)